jgi:hypothetical protein
LAALAAGAAKGLTDTAAAAVGDLYKQLKSAVKKRLEGNQRAENTLDEYLEDPVTYDKPMAKQLSEARVDTDMTVLELARAVMDKLDPDGSKTGKYQIDARGVRNLQAGDHNIQHNA